MTELTPEQLIEQMAKARYEKFIGCWETASEDWKNCVTEEADCMLRIVLKAISDGEVVELKLIEGCAEDTYEIVLKPSFSKFLEGA